MTDSTMTGTEAQERAPKWRLILGELQLSLRFPDFASALEFLNAVGAVAEEQNHHPRITLGWGRVNLAVSSHDVGGLTERDVAFAHAVDALVVQHSATPAHDALTQCEIAIDTIDAATILPFWEAVLGYERAGDDALVDPNELAPAVWFQQLDEPRPVRNRIHLDVTVAHDQAQHRIDAALAAGGRLVSDERAPRFWILADADGNEACICTWQGRD